MFCGCDSVALPSLFPRWQDLENGLVKNLPPSPLTSTGTAMFSSLLSRIAWNPYYASSPRRHSMSRLKLPAIITALDSKFELEVNEWCSAVTKDTKEWTESQIDFTHLKIKRSQSAGEATEEEVHDSSVIPDIKPSLLSAMAYPFADFTQLRVCADCLQWMFLLQWWAFEGPILFEYENSSECPDANPRQTSGLNIEEGLLKLLDRYCE